jgi:hypothetical protein
MEGLCRRGGGRRREMTRPRIEFQMQDEIPADGIRDGGRGMVRMRRGDAVYGRLFVSRKRSSVTRHLHIKPHARAAPRQILRQLP